MGIWYAFADPRRKSRSSERLGTGVAPDAPVTAPTSSEQRTAISTPKHAESCSTVPFFGVDGVFSRGFGGTDGVGRSGGGGGAATAMATAVAVTSRHTAASSSLWITFARGQLETGATMAP